MIFFGTKGRLVTGKPVQGVACPNCENNQFMSFGVLRYFHLYWIPTIPTSRKIGIECTNCHQALYDDEVPGHLKEQIKSDVFTVGRTLPMFTGVFMLALASLWIYDAHQGDLAEETAFLAQPAVHDYYIVDLSKIFENSDPEYPYGLLRINDIHSTEVEMQIGSVVYNKGSGFWQDIREGKAAVDSYYEPGSIVFEIAELQAYQDNGAIYSIERD